MQLQVTIADTSTTPLSKSSQLSEIDAAVKGIQGLQEELSGQTVDLENRLRSPSPAATPGQATALSPTLQAYVDQQVRLRTQLEQKNAQLERIQQTRDLDRSTYELLRSRLAEQTVNGTISDIVVIGSAADEEQTAHSRSLLRSLVLDTGEWILIAVALGIGLAYLLSLVRPNFNSNDAIGRRIYRGGPKAARVSRSE
jgi:hypothetical protein